MSRFRFLGLAALALALSVLAVRGARAADMPAHGEMTCVIYSLGDLGDDADLGAWIAETIPQVIEQGSWAHQGEQGHMLRYYAPKRSSSSITRRPCRPRWTRFSRTSRKWSRRARPSRSTA
jgi:hypothetical protein